MKHIIRNIFITISVISLFALTGCGNQTFDAPENSIRSQIKGPRFGVSIELQNKENKDIDYKEEKLSEELRTYIVENVADYKKNRYLIQLEPKVGIRWIDFEKGETTIYYPPSDKGYTNVGSVSNSPDGNYIALNITKGQDSPWSQLLIIDTKKHTYSIPLTDEVLLTPPEGSQCLNIKIVDKRTEKDKSNECVIETPNSMYMIDYWSSNKTVEIVKQFPSSTILYSVNVK